MLQSLLLQTQFLQSQFLVELITSVFQSLFCRGKKGNPTNAIVWLWYENVLLYSLAVPLNNESNQVHTLPLQYTFNVESLPLYILILGMGNGSRSQKKTLGIGHLLTVLWENALVLVSIPSRQLCHQIKGQKTKQILLSARQVVQVNVSVLRAILAFRWMRGGRRRLPRVYQLRRRPGREQQVI